MWNNSNAFFLEHRSHTSQHPPFFDGDGVMLWCSSSFFNTRRLRSASLRCWDNKILNVEERRMTQFLPQAPAGNIDYRPFQQPNQGGTDGNSIRLEESSLCLLEENQETIVTDKQDRKGWLLQRWNQKRMGTPNMTEERWCARVSCRYASTVGKAHKRSQGLKTLWEKHCHVRCHQSFHTRYKVSLRSLGLDNIAAWRQPKKSVCL